MHVLSFMVLLVKFFTSCSFLCVCLLHQMQPAWWSTIIIATSTYQNKIKIQLIKTIGLITCMAAAQYQHKREKMAVAVTL
jgi:hypothetical protein